MFVSEMLYRMLFIKCYYKMFIHYQDNIVKVGPAIDENTGKASLKAKPILDNTEDNGSQNYALNVSTGW